MLPGYDNSYIIIALTPSLVKEFFTELQHSLRLIVSCGKRVSARLWNAQLDCECEEQAAPDVVARADSASVAEPLPNCLTLEVGRCAGTTIEQQAARGVL